MCSHFVYCIIQLLFFLCVCVCLSVPLKVEHEQIQKRTFTNWINAQLSKVSKYLISFTQQKHLARKGLS
uniref:Calponin-homology (CH) domain-containing protein n=1 Tax=Mola mola TaxID=94237 RepID=A0A3Q4BJW0_MOLML